VAVCDDGCGMDAQTLSRVFEPFFTTKRVGQGSGLGMSMVYGFARQSGGTVDIASEPGVGTTVSLWLPRGEVPHTQAADPSAPEPTSQPSAVGTNGLALLVEDDGDVRKVIRRHLLELGYAVLEAESGQEALDILAQTRDLQVVLSDLVMPGTVDGQQVTRHAQSLGHIAKVVLMSGYTPSAGQTEGVPLIQKPFSREQLDAVLQSFPN
jgi:CheY-like chemotaxis protein